MELIVRLPLGEAVVLVVDEAEVVKRRRLKFGELLTVHLNFAVEKCAVDSRIGE
jgi:hypothetical protein